MRLANALSLLRVLLTPPLLVLLLWPPVSSLIAATALWFVSSWSDVFDGWVARRSRGVSKLGVFVDLIADKVATSSVLVALVELGILPAWLVAVVLTREFVIMGLRTFAAAEGVVIPAAAWGKQKTIITNLAIGMLFLWADYQRGGPTAELPALGVPLAAAPWLFYLAVLLTVTSGIRYVYDARGLLARLAD